MFKRVGYILLSVALSISFLSESLIAQSNAYWSCYLKREQTTMLAKAKTKTFALADGALYAFSSKALNSSEANIQLYDKTNGLNDVDISYIAYNTAAECLFIYYGNGAIDLLRADDTYYIDAIKEAKDIRKKGIKDLKMQGESIYFAGDFGISVLNLSNNFIEATFFRNEQVQSLTLNPKKRELYALKGNILYLGSLTKNLQDPMAWHSLDIKLEGDKPLPKLKQIRYYQNKLLALSNEGVVYKLEHGQAKEIELSTKIKALKESPMGLMLKTEQNGLYLLKSLSEPAKLIAKGQVLDCSIANDKIGLTLLYPKNKFALLSSIKAKPKFVQLKTNSPFDNKYFEMRVQNGMLYTINGGPPADSVETKAVAQCFDGINWQNLSSEIKDCSDPISILPHYSGEKGHCYVGTWAKGLFELKNGKVIKHYDSKNSALQMIVEKNKKLEEKTFIRAGALAYDRYKTLWVGEGRGFIASMSKDAKWQGYKYSKAEGIKLFSKQIIMPNGLHWLSDYIEQNAFEGLFAFDTKGTTNLSDDLSAHYSDFIDRNSKPISIGRIKAMCLDKSGSIWLGSGIGYSILTYPNKLPQGHKAVPLLSRPIAGEEPPYYYVLDGIAISAIVVDNLNRKWIGTENQGVYLLSPDGLQVLEHYRVEDSPLLSNRISSLAFDEVNALLYIGTNKGLNSLKVNSDEQSLSSEPRAIAYPNPLRDEDPDIITFEGLPANANILISDTYGHVVHKHLANGTTYKWKIYGDNGRRLSGGVYFAHIYAPNYNTPQQIKIAIIDSNTYQ